MNASIARAGFVLILLSLFSGLFVNAMAIPRLGLAAHTIGLLSGVLLIAVAAIWSHFQLGPGKLAVVKWGWIYSSYANWLGCLIGAIAGAGKTTPIAAAGAAGSGLAEAVVMILLLSVAVTSIPAAALSIMGLKQVGGSGAAAETG